MSLIHKIAEKKFKEEKSDAILIENKWKRGRRKYEMRPKKVINICPKNKCKGNNYIS